MTTSYETWLDAMLNKPSGAITPLFWRRHRHHELVARWAAAVGPGHVTVIVSDDDNRQHALRVVEQLTGLRAGTLEPEPDLANRSLTRAEIETIRAFNVAFREEGLSAQLHGKVMRFGAAEHLKRRPVGAGEARIETPAWAVERAAEVSREIVAGIAASGVRVIGDLDDLAPAKRAARARRGRARADAAEPARAGAVIVEDRAAGGTPDDAWSQIGARMAAGILLASGLARGAAAKAGADRAWPDGPIEQGPPPPRAQIEPIELARVSTPLLALVVIRRLVGAVLARFLPSRRAA
jgi:hypothetical protein